MKAEMKLPGGFRFHPTDDEMVNHYLLPKCASQAIGVPIIAEIDLYKFDPWQLPDMALYGEKEWYFFSPRKRKYPNGSRPNRAAGTGYWKATGADKPIGRPNPLGIKKALVFYAGKAPKGMKTDWIMHEYRLANVDRSASKKNKNMTLDEWVLCRIYNKKGQTEKHYVSDQKPEPFAEMEEMEDKKPFEEIEEMEDKKPFEEIEEMEDKKPEPWISLPVEDPYSMTAVVTVLNRMRDLRPSLYNKAVNQACFNINWREAFIIALPERKRGLIESL